jgi:hypothetical protein
MLKVKGDGPGLLSGSVFLFKDWLGAYCKALCTVVPLLIDLHPLLY